MEGRELARIIRRLPIEQPITDAYQSTQPMGASRPGGPFRDQREHLVGWLSEISGPGAYNRQATNGDATAAYNHFQCAPGLLWLAEALGEDSDVVRHAARATQAAPGRAASQCAAIRRLIPWSRVEDLARGQRRRWLPW